MSDEKINFTIRTDKILRDAFLDACKTNDRPASQVLRDFMRQYVEKNAQGKLKL